MRQDILQALKALDLQQLRKAEHDIYAFTHKERTYLFVYKPNNFVQICLPEAIKADGLSELATYKLMERINSEIRYIKAFLVDNKILFACETLMPEGVDVKKYIHTMLYVLDGAVKQYELEIALTAPSPKLLPYKELIGKIDKNSYN